jgi:hypothetical protein
MHVNECRALSGLKCAGISLALFLLGPTLHGGGDIRELNLL